ncbi:hypothetical protein DSO57_1022255 [Entomophthora muscae]|nr:hypothetical protein DSO57_1022255 [Entomophthora muscae]
MPNPITHSSRLSSILPSMQDINLREILDRFSEDPELLKAVLKAKRDELKVRAEEINLQTEKVRLEIGRLDRDGVKDYTSPVSHYNYHSPPKPTYAYARVGSSNNLDCYISEETSYNGNKRQMPKHHLHHDMNEYNTLPPLHHNIEANHNTIKLKEAPAPSFHQLKCWPSREKVMEALRNKVRHNSFKRAKSNAAGPVLPPIKSSNFPTNGVHTPSNVQRIPQDTPQSLSALQPRDSSSASSSLGPFSAPVGGPHPEFQFPPSSRHESIQSKHTTPES